MKLSIDITKCIEIKFKMCSHCFGSGRLKAMQSMAIYGGGSIRGKDTQVKCSFCNGTGTAN